VLFTGRFVERKGIGDLLDAIPIVLRDVDDARFVLAGGHRGSTGDEMARYWAPGHMDRIQFTGWLSAEEMSAWYRAADVLVVPSWYEPFGMVVLEGMLHGLAIAAAKVGGPAEILEEGRTGLLFPARDPIALASSLVRLLTNPELRRELGSAAAAEVRETWAYARVVRRVRSVYEEALTSPAARPAAPR
jgi:glycogen(starch) synthase